MMRNVSMDIGDVGLGSIELCAIAAEAGCTHKYRAGSPAVPFAREFTTTVRPACKVYVLSKEI